MPFHKLALNFIIRVSDYLIWYAKDKEKVKYRQLFLLKTPGGQGGEAYAFVRLPDESIRRATANEIENYSDLGKQGYGFFRLSDMRSQSGSESISFTVEFDGNAYIPRGLYWKTNKEGFRNLILASRIHASGNSLNYIRYITDFPSFPINNLWSDVGSGVGDKIYVVQTNSTIIQRCLLMTTDPGDLVLDPTCGSGTTAYVAEQWGRRWITVDTSRVALALARTRLMSAKLPYYLLADSAEGVKKETEITGRTPPTYTTGNDIRKGFVYKRVPHVTLKSIANNPDIKEGMTRKEIDEAIARHADTETLYDQPYEDNKRVPVGKDSELFV